ncbi:MFS transporter [Actinomadura darangshiensis]|uniref:MFS transporter n=1 Tax=Actinomadura darangshiensis TaxID=705336 RepID=A0A4R5BWK6_9ACTN|nr:MFS transporter [Actinomadura darangshiensis]TDD88682.1 MFS transporter [Actinomadura darangshiensis]
MTQTTDLRGAASGRGSRNGSGGLALAVILLGQFMAILDVNIVNVALPTMRADLHASGAGLQLVVAGYIVAYAVLLITGARLGDIAGHRRMFHLGLASFTVASLACGLAPGTGAVVVFRLLQGAGAALLTPQVMSMIQRDFTGAARMRALGLYSVVIAGGVVVGQAAGGLLVSADLFGAGWRTVFLVNVPIGVALLIAGPRLLHRDGEPRRTAGARADLDLPGLLTLAAAVLLFVVPLIMGHELGWPAWGWVSLAASAVFMAAFAAVERRVATTGGRPLISPRVLRAPLLVPACVALALGPGSWGSFLFTTTLHLQGDLKMSPLQSGLAFVPSVTVFGLVGLNWRRLPARWHRWLIPAGFAIAAAGYLFVGPLAGGGVPYEALTVVIGIGLGVMPIIMTTALQHVPAEDAADASGLLLTVMQLAQVIGIATVGTVFLTLAESSGSTRHAEYGTGWMLAGAALVGALSALSLTRSRPPGRT